MDIRNEQIGSIVANDFRTAAIFKKYGIDFCCKGGRTIEEATEKKGLDKNKIYQDIESLPQSNGGEIDFTSWPLDLLSDYVEKTHHRYIRESRHFTAILDKLCKFTVVVILNYLKSRNYSKNL